jgi:hypothetical protein
VELCPSHVVDLVAQSASCSLLLPPAIHHKSSCDVWSHICHFEPPFSSRVCHSSTIIVIQRQYSPSHVTFSSIRFVNILADGFNDDINIASFIMMTIDCEMTVFIALYEIIYIAIPRSTSLAFLTLWQLPTHWTWLAFWVTNECEENTALHGKFHGTVDVTSHFLSKLFWKGKIR